ncbi:MAG: alpha/beta hydrolase [Rhodoferax sp.]|nr:alpha/beta hydrolase [Rhodoferax sp.]
MYQVKRHFRSEFVPVRNLSYHVRIWGEASADSVPLVMLHGWMDVGASYQFVVDALAADHHVIAPDWRGYGLTRGGPVDNYWIPDYLADLDFLLDHYAGDRAVHLVGHSMGGNVVMQYGGVRPERVRRLVNLEGFGMPATQPAQAPGRYARWMDELKQFHRGEMALKSYDSVDQVARRLMKTNRRLTRDKADWLARHWAEPDAQGRWHILGDPAHKIVNAQLFRVEELLGLYQRLTMPVLSVEAGDNTLQQWTQGRYSLDEYHQRLKSVPQVDIVRIEDAGHMLHHDQPQRLAEHIEAFLA